MLHETLNGDIVGDRARGRGYGVAAFIRVPRWSPGGARGQRRGDVLVALVMVACVTAIPGVVTRGAAVMCASGGAGFDGLGAGASYRFRLPKSVTRAVRAWQSKIGNQVT